MSSHGERGGERPEDARENRAAAERPLKRTESLRDGVEQYGEAFLAYITLPNVDIADPQIVENFVGVYGGYYDNRRSFIDGQIESVGWPEALAAFRQTEGIWQDDLLWNYDELWRHCLEVYSVNERFGGVHVFFN